MRWRAHAARAALSRHPWAIRLMESRAAPGAATLRHHDQVLGCLRRAEFSLRMAGHAYAVLDGFTYGFVLTEQNLPFQTPDETQQVADGMMKNFPVGEYPNLVAFATQYVLRPGYSYGNEFKFGLELILDGLERALRADKRTR